MKILNMNYSFFINCRRFVSPRLLLCSAAYLVFAVSSIFAQTALTGGLRGIVTDANGAAIPSAVVRLENKSLSVKQETTTDANGRFVILNLVPATDYQMQVSANGFQLLSRNGVAIVSSETVAVDTQLEIATVAENVEVTGAEAQLTQSSEISQIIDEKKLNELPLYNRSLNRAGLLDSHVRNTQGLGSDASSGTRLSVNGRIFRETHYKLDGNANFDALFNNAPLQSISLSSVQEFKVLTNQYAAEHGGTTAGFLIATTKSGTNDFHGEAFFIGRPSGIQARPPLADRRIPNQLLQYGGTLGGAVLRDKTFFLVNYEGTRQDRASFINRPLPTTFLGKLRETLGLVKIDQHFTDQHTASVRFNFNRTTNTNANDRVTFLAQSSQPIQPSAAAFSETQALGVQISDNYVINSNFINEFRVSYTNSLPSNSSPVTPSVVVIRNGISTEGNSSYSNIRLQNTQVVDQMSLQVGRHSFKFGGDYTRQILHDVQFQQFGTYTFASNGAPVSFQQQLGVADLHYGQTRFATFFQDDWRASSRLTLNLGLRYDYQSIIDDYNNFGPRFGFAYDFGGKGDTVIRGGAGVYYDQPFLHGFTQRYLLNAPNGLTRQIRIVPNDPSGVPFPTFPFSFDPRTPFNSFPPAIQSLRRNLFVRGEEIRNPYTVQFSIGVQRKLFGDWIANADYIHNNSRGFLTAFNINAPSPFPRTEFGQVRSAAVANATRPLTTYEGVPVNDVFVSLNAGKSSYDALALSIAKRFGNRYTFAANYVLSEAIDTVNDDHLGSNANESSDFINAEFAPSDFNQRHRFVAYGTVALPYSFEFSGIITIASGIRINPLTGVDNNGDGRAFDRPPGFTRNSFQGKGQKRFDASLVRSFKINEKAQVELRADIFNVFNNSNFYRFNNNYGNTATPSPTFGQPIGGVSNVDPGRQLQFAARFVF